MKKILSLACCAALAGCLHAAPGEVKPAPVSAPAAVKKEKPVISALWVEQNIVRGKTTKEELLALLGNPSAVDRNDQQLSKELLGAIKTGLPPIARTKEFWKYRSVTRIPNKPQSSVCNLMVFMDDNGVAVDYLVSESELTLP